MVRAMLEAMCFQTREVSEAMCRDAQEPALQVLPPFHSHPPTHLPVPLFNGPLCVPGLLCISG